MRLLKKVAAAVAPMISIVAPSMAMSQQSGLARVFGAREYVEQASLSPDGSKIAFVEALAGQASRVRLLDLKQPTPEPIDIVSADGKPERIAGCRWVSNQRLMCDIYGITKVDGQPVYASRVVALYADGSRLKVLPMPRGFGYALFGGAVVDWNPGKDGHVLMMRQQLRTAQTGSRIGNVRSGLALEMVDTVSLRGATAEPLDPDAAEYISDGKGNIRIVGRIGYNDATGQMRPGRRYLYRAAGDQRWQPLSEVLPDRLGFDPHGIDAERDLAFGLKRVDGRMAALTKALDGSGAETLLFAHPEVDVDGFARIGRRGRIVGVTYATDVRQVKYFDPVLAKLAADLSQALPKTPLIRFVDASEDEQVLLLWAGADNDPGRYYLLDRKARKLEPLMEDRPQLANRMLATMKPIRYRAADGTMVPGYLTLPPVGAAKGLPALVMPHGGPGARDEWGFDWLAQYFAAEGYAVLQPNFRGSTGYGEGWFRKNGFQSWETAIGDVNDAGRWMVSEGIADPQRLGIFGWSYGGYAALQSALLDPALFKAIVAVAPVTDLGQLAEARRGWSDYQMVRNFIGTGPHIAAGSPARNADRFAAPVLMFHGDLDRNVGIAQARLMQSRLEAAGKKSELVVFDGLDHYLQDGAVREQMLAKSSAFLKQTMGD